MTGLSTATPTPGTARQKSWGMSFRSAPAVKALSPAPARMATLSSLALKRCQAALRPATTSWVRMLYFSARLMVISAMPSRDS